MLNFANGGTCLFLFVSVLFCPCLSVSARFSLFHREERERTFIIPEDQRTINVLTEIGKSIYKCVQYTIDCPSQHPSTRKVPFLDLQVYIQDNMFMHEFYEKPVASKFVFPIRSAHSKKMKMAVLVE